MGRVELTFSNFVELTAPAFSFLRLADTTLGAVLVVGRRLDAMGFEVAAVKHES